MAEVFERIEAEFDNIERVVKELNANDSLINLSSLELAGVAALIHNFYNGIENVLKQLFIFRNIELPTGASWHRDMVNIAVSNNIISKSTAEQLWRYLAFRHFFSHAYSLDLDKEQITPLFEDISQTLKSFRTDVKQALDQA